MELINDKRLTPTMDRIRSGSKQLFRESSEDVRSFISSDNCDVLLEHGNKEMYADLIDGQWYWVSGCAECKGEERGWTSYIECEKHDRCRKCSILRKDIKEDSVWGGGHGWTCYSCHEKEESERKEAAFEKLNGEEPDCSYTDEVVCPHCGSNLGCDDIHQNKDMDCWICKGEMGIEIDYTVRYTTTIKGERVTK